MIPEGLDLFTRNLGPTTIYSSVVAPCCSAVKDGPSCVSEESRSQLAGVMREMLGANNEERETRIRLQVRI